MLTSALSAPMVVSSSPDHTTFRTATKSVVPLLDNALTTGVVRTGLMRFNTRAFGLSRIWSDMGRAVAIMLRGRYDPLLDNATKERGNWP